MEAKRSTKSRIIERGGGRVTCYRCRSSWAQQLPPCSSRDGSLLLRPCVCSPSWQWVGSCRVALLWLLLSFWSWVRIAYWRHHYRWDGRRYYSYLWRRCFHRVSRRLQIYRRCNRFRTFRKVYLWDPPAPWSYWLAFWSYRCPKLSQWGSHEWSDICHLAWTLLKNNRRSFLLKSSSALGANSWSWGQCYQYWLIAAYHITSACLYWYQKQRDYRLQDAFD